MVGLLKEIRHRAHEEQRKNLLFSCALFVLRLSRGVNERADRGSEGARIRPHPPSAVRQLAIIVVQVVILLMLFYISYILTSVSRLCII